MRQLAPPDAYSEKGSNTTTRLSPSLRGDLDRIVRRLNAGRSQSAKKLTRGKVISWALRLYVDECREAGML